MPSAFSMPPIRCSRPGVPGTAHGRASVSRVAQVRPELRRRRRRVVWFGPVANSASIVGRSVDVRDPPRLGAVGQVAVGEQEHRRAVGDRDPGRLERGVEAVAGRAAAPRSAPAPRRCGRTSPAAGRPARSWSAARSTGRRAGRRRRSAAARATRPRPIVSDFSAMPGPDVVVTPSAPPNAAPSAAPTPAISSSAWKVRDAEALVLAQLVQDVGGRGDRVGAEEQRQAGLAARPRSGRRPAPGCR